MLALYRSALRLYPAAYRLEYGQEMTGVFCKVEAEVRGRGFKARAMFCVRELTGLLGGALQEHLRALAGFRSWGLLPSRRLTMRTQFRYPNVAIVLMTIVFAIVIGLIDRGLDISASLLRANPALPPIQTVQHSLTQTFAVLFAIAWLAGLIGWAVLYALRRSGSQRLSDVQTWPQQR